MNIREIETLLPDTLMCVKDVKTNKIIYPEDATKLAYLTNLKRISNDEFYDSDLKRYYERKVSYTENGLEVCQFIDITKYKQKIIELETDPVLNIPIKRKMYDELQNYIEACKEEPANSSVVILDIDHFKRINDGYGHLEGDFVLRDVAGFLTNNTRHNTNPNAPKRPEDGIFRFGGEEIVLLLKNISPEDSLRRLNEIREKQANRIYRLKKDNKTLCTETITFSAGIAPISKSTVFPSSKEGVRAFIDEKINEADEQLYYAKETGRNKVKMYC